MGLVQKIRARLERKPLTEARLQRLADAAAAKETFNDLKAAAKSAANGRIQLEKQLGVIARRPR